MNEGICLSAGFSGFEGGRGFEVPNPQMSLKEEAAAFLRDHFRAGILQLLAAAGEFEHHALAVDFLLLANSKVASLTGQGGTCMQQLSVGV